jgi:hypothetical protein
MQNVEFDLIVHELRIRTEYAAPSKIVLLAFEIVSGQTADHGRVRVCSSAACGCN